MDYNKNGGIWKAYAARDYTPDKPRTSPYIEVNIPEYMPTIPQDGSYTNIALTNSYFVNDNYPNTTGIVKASHFIALPLMYGTFCPVYFKKGTQFLLIVSTNKMEEGRLVYLSEERME